MSVHLQARAQVTDDDSLITRTHKKLLLRLKEQGKTLDVVQSQSIKEILEEAFQDADEAEELLTLKETFIEDLTHTNDELLQRVTKISGEHDILKRKFDVLEDDGRRLQNDFDALHKRSQATERDYLDLKKQTDALKSDSRDLLGKYEDLEGQYKDLNRENDDLKDKFALLEEESEKLSDDYQQLEEKNTKLKEEAECLKLKYDELEAQYKELNKETQEWSSRYEDLMSNYTKLQTIVDDAIKDQKKQLDMKTQKKTDKIPTDGFPSCSAIWNFTLLQVCNSMPLPLHLIYQFAKKYFEQIL